MQNPLREHEPQEDEEIGTEVELKSQGDHVREIRIENTQNCQPDSTSRRATSREVYQWVMGEQLYLKIAVCFTIFAGSITFAALTESGDYDDDGECSDLADGKHQFLIGGAVCGMVSCMVTMASFLMNPKQQTYSSIVAIYQTAADFLTSFAFCCFYMSNKNVGGYNGELSITVPLGCIVVFILWRSRPAWGINSMVVFIAGLAFRYHLNIRPYQECRWVSALTLGFLINQELRPLVISFDLYRTLCNPFLDFHKTLRKYDRNIKAFAIFVVIFAASLESCKHCASNVCKNAATGRFIFGQEADSSAFICFLSHSYKKENGDTKYSPYTWFWGLYAAPMISIVLSLMCLSYLAYKKLVSTRLPKSIMMRFKIIMINFRNLFIQIIYYFVLLGLLGMAKYVDETSFNTVFSGLTSFVLAAKGWFDLTIWCSVNKEIFPSEWTKPLQKRSSKVGEDTQQLNFALLKEMQSYLQKGLFGSSTPPDLEPGSKEIGYRNIPLQKCGSVDFISASDFVRLVFQDSVSANIFFTSRRSSENPSSPCPPQRLQPHHSLGKVLGLDTERGPLFTEHLPHLFHRVREVFGVAREEYERAWSESEGTLKMKLNDGGSSNAFFIFSPCRRFIIKSCTKEEFRLLKKISESYTKHVEKYPHTFIARLYGAYELVVYGNEFYFFVMENLFTLKQGVVHERYDIKGSWVDRNFTKPAKGDMVTCALCNMKYRQGGPSICSETVSGEHKPNVIFKDNDLGSKLRVSHAISVCVARQLETDSQFLMNWNIMDYSLLLGVFNAEIRLQRGKHDNKDGEWSHIITAIGADSEPGEKETDRLTGDDVNPVDDVSSSNSSMTEKISNNDGSVRMSLNRFDTLSEGHRMGRSATNVHEGKPRTSQGQDCSLDASFLIGPHMYHLGMIDILQEWTIGKRLERWAKCTLLGKDPDGLSAIEPITYQRRFMQKINTIFNLSDDAADMNTGRPFTTVDQPALATVQDSHGRGSRGSVSTLRNTSETFTNRIPSEMNAI